LIIFDIAFQIIKIKHTGFYNKYMFKLCVDNLIILEGYINNCQNGMVFISNYAKNNMQINFKNSRRLRYAILLTETSEKVEHETQWSCVNLSRLVGSEQYVVTQKIQKKKKIIK